MKGVFLIASAMLVFAAEAARADVLPTLSPQASAACPADRKAAVDKAVQPVYPLLYRSMPPADVLVLVQVVVDATGKVKDATVQQSSGIKQFDEASVEAAVNSTYKPAIFNCVAATGTYVFRAEYR